MNKEKVVVDLYNFFYKKVYKDNSYHIALEKNQNPIKKFINELHVSNGYGNVGINFLADYFCFQWEYWLSKNTQRNVQLSWIIGDKALQRWVGRNHHYQYFYGLMLVKHNISFNKLLSFGESWLEKTTDQEINMMEEREKIFFDGELRLIHCIENTTLYNPFSKICVNCTNKENCKEILLNREDLMEVAIKRKLY